MIEEETEKERPQKLKKDKGVHGVTKVKGGQYFKREGTVLYDKSH